MQFKFGELQLRFENMQLKMEVATKNLNVRLKLEGVTKIGGCY